MREKRRRDRGRRRWHQVDYTKILGIRSAPCRSNRPSPLTSPPSNAMGFPQCPQQHRCLKEEHGRQPEQEHYRNNKLGSYQKRPGSWNSGCFKQTHPSECRAYLEKGW